MVEKCFGPIEGEEASAVTYSRKDMTDLVGVKEDGHLK
jgi:hypothetical protein